MRVCPLRGGKTFFEKRIKSLSGFAGTGLAAAHKVNRCTRFKIVAEVGPGLVGDPFGLRFRTLVVLRGIEKTAIAAAVKVRVAIGAGVPPLHLVARQ
jgi:hypothetical protein